jgi:hypothetical protein
MLISQHFFVIADPDPDPGHFWDPSLFCEFNSNFL